MNPASATLAGTVATSATVATASSATNVLFALLVAAVASIWVRAARIATAGPAGATRPGPAAGLAAAGMIAWLVVPAALARAGLLDRWTPPAPALLLTGIVTVGTIVLACSRVGARLAASAPLAGLVGYQVFRVPVELLLHRLYLEGVVPVQMTYAGRNFDILSGLGAAALAIALLAGRRPRALTMIWNVGGLLLLANIVGIAVLSTPSPFRHFLEDPPNRLPGTFPFVWLPTFLVQAALFGHLVTFRALARRAA